jgi:hypothetical protein
MSTNGHKKKWGFFITEDRSHGFYKVNLSAVFENSGGLLDHASARDLGQEGLLKITCQCSTDFKTSYAWRVEYNSTLTQENFDEVAKVFSRMNRALAKFDTEDGRAETYGRFCFRVAKALGASYFVKKRDGIPLEDHNYQMPLADGIQTINSMLHEWIDANYKARGVA